MYIDNIIIGCTIYVTTRHKGAHTMVRTQITLEPEQHKILDKKPTGKRVSRMFAKW
jgi:hypothetical protein